MKIFLANDYVVAITHWITTRPDMMMHLIQMELLHPLNMTHNFTNVDNSAAGNKPQNPQVNMQS
jgi:hypothetical protein